MLSTLTFVMVAFLFVDLAVTKGSAVVTFLKSKF